MSLQSAHEQMKTVERKLDELKKKLDSISDKQSEKEIENYDTREANASR